LWDSSVSFRAFDDLREAAEPLQPRADALEGRGRKHARADTADLVRRHELRVLEQRMCFFMPVSDMAEIPQAFDSAFLE
jgi:hypothetical protein